MINIIYIINRISEKQIHVVSSFTQNNCKVGEKIHILAFIYLNINSKKMHEKAVIVVILVCFRWESLKDTYGKGGKGIEFSLFCVL